jgi:hypothetical protein
MSYRTEIPFRIDFFEAIRLGRKTTTARTRKYGKPGDILKVRGSRMVIKLIDVYPIPLGEVAKRFFRQEGCESPMEFRMIWEELHPHKPYNDKTKVFLHEFIFESMAP